MKALDYKDSEVLKLLRRLENKKLIDFHDNKYYLNSDIVRRGGLHYKNGRYARLFISNFEYVYYNLESINRKRFSHFISFIPFINLEYNILCSNPYEKDINKIKHMRAEDLFLKAVGNIKYIKSSSSKLINNLLKLKLPNGQNVMIREKVVGNKNRYIINPNLIYGGKNIDNFRVVESKFKIK